MPRMSQEMPITSVSICDYAFGAGGRVLNLPPRYLDAICAANARAHPRALSRRVAELMVKDSRFRTSSHPLLGTKTLYELRSYRSEIDRRYEREFRRRHGPRRRISKRPSAGETNVI